MNLLPCLYFGQKDEMRAITLFWLGFAISIGWMRAPNRKQEGRDQ